MSTFDPYDWDTFFFGALERDEACRLLSCSQVGAFLLRESKSRPGGYSLSVRERADGDHQIHHYFIEKELCDNGTDDIRFKMCGNTFVDIPSLLTHYQKHTLEHSCLRRPITKQPLCRVIARYKFDGERATDLSFERGEILDIIDKPEELWWSAKNALNNTGLIPVTYVKTYEDGDEISLLNPSTNSSNATTSSGSAGGGGAGVAPFDDKRFSATSIVSDSSANGGVGGATTAARPKRTSQPDLLCNHGGAVIVLDADKNVPAWVRVVADRHPSIYDEDAFTLKRGQLLYLMEILPSGMCRGRAEPNGRVGVFPFTYVEWVNVPPDAAPWMPLPSQPPPLPPATVAAQ